MKTKPEVIDLFKKAYGSNNYEALKRWLNQNVITDPILTKLWLFTFPPQNYKIKSIYRDISDVEYLFSYRHAPGFYSYLQDNFLASWSAQIWEDIFKKEGFCISRNDLFPEFFQSFLIKYPFNKEKSEIKKQIVCLSWPFWVEITTITINTKGKWLATYDLCIEWDDLMGESADKVKDRFLTKCIKPTIEKFTQIYLEKDDKKYESYLISNYADRIYLDDDVVTANTRREIL